MPLDVKAAIGRELTPERMTPRDEASYPADRCADRNSNPRTGRCLRKIALSMRTHGPTLSRRDSARAAPRTEALTEGEMAARHAAVCAGAVMYLPDLRVFAKGMSANRHQADDLVQSTILRALDASHQFMPGTNFRAWTFTILRNLFYNQWRSPASRVESIENCMHNMPVTDPSQDKALELCDLRRALAQLGPEQRRAFCWLWPRASTTRPLRRSAASPTVR
jgi:RNA polymerase sigma factor (sigma-70 family)